MGGDEGTTLAAPTGMVNKNRKIEAMLEARKA